MTRRENPRRPGRVAEGNKLPDNSNTDIPSANFAARLGVDLPTRYRNATFPTPLEARWAEFFDLLKICWEYNPRIDQLGRPLPFWLAFSEWAQCYYPAGYPEERGMWVDISPTEPDPALKLRLRNLASQSDHWTYLIIGAPQPRFEVWSWRLSKGITIDGRHELADLKSNWMRIEDYTSFTTDFAFNTIGGDHTTVERAFLAMAP
jgi:hypothetical protein